MTGIEARKIASGELPGVVRVDGEFHYLLLFVAEWILDYDAYDPSHPTGADENGHFRNGLWVVGPGDGRRFLAAVDEFEVASDQLDALSAVNGLRSRPQVFIDFDTGRQVSWFYDIAVETYAGAGWDARFGDPVPLLPTETQERWPLPPTEGD